VLRIEERVQPEQLRRPRPLLTDPGQPRPRVARLVAESGSLPPRWCCALPARRRVPAAGALPGAPWAHQGAPARAARRRDPHDGTSPTVCRIGRTPDGSRHDRPDLWRSGRPVRSVEQRDQDGGDGPEREASTPSPSRRAGYEVYASNSDT
jgi:hypothetical protein